jgi:hypothetical protein
MELLEGQAERITQKAIKMALEGDMTALKLCLERLLPPRRDRPVSLDLPPVKTAADVRLGYDRLTQALSEGAISPAEGKLVSDVLEKHGEAIERSDMAIRLEEIERYVFPK